jgi:hypothetical protein
VSEGRTGLTVMPSSPTVADSARVNPTTAILLVQYAIETGLAITTVAEVTFDASHPRPCISNRNALHVNRSVQIDAHHPLPELGVELAQDACSKMPALLRRMSRVSVLARELRAYGFRCSPGR